MTSDYQRGASEMREMAARLFDEEREASFKQIEDNKEYTRRVGRGDDIYSPANQHCRDIAGRAGRWGAAIRALPLPADPASGEGADETGPPKIITPGNALWAFGLAEEEVKRLRAENAGLRAALAEAIEAIRLAKKALDAALPHIILKTNDTLIIMTGEALAAIAALANPARVEGMDAPNHIMCIGWETIKRLAAGVVWIESIQAGAVAADDLLGVDINALLAALASPDKPEGGR